MNARRTGWAAGREWHRAAAVALLAAIVSLASGGARASDAPGDARDLAALYEDLHAHPELAFQEERTARLLAGRVAALGYEVTEHVGRSGFVAVLRNGPGPVVMLRTELDALPLEEKTGAPFASHARGHAADGAEVPVAHACGHDLHMTAWFGTAQRMAASRREWHGTLLLIGQPAEEVGRGAQAMLDDGLLSRFPRPDYALSVHDEPSLPAGVFGFHPGYFRAATDEVTVVLHGRGGHGAKPYTTVDPVVLAARAILGLQTIVSRETDPASPVVVTVGTIQGGSAANIIPDEVKLSLTVRSFDPKSRERTLASIRRQLDGEAAAAGAPEPPTVSIRAAIEPVYNDPATTARLVEAIRRALGPERAVEMPQKMTSEDFSVYGRAGIKAVLLHIGATDADQLREHGVQADLHSSHWLPALHPTLENLVEGEVAALRELLSNRPPPPRRH
ncbi:MAG: amidohydrolase [Proteobacteria bacterium]|nr:amidohydrolase [Pseudomonadota bacterium]